MKSYFYCFLFLLFIVFTSFPQFLIAQTKQWGKFEQSFTSTKSYDNPIYQVKVFNVQLTSPTGRVKKINGFWDGGREWKFRFAPDEEGLWTWGTFCSDTSNTGLHNIEGSFNCIPNNTTLSIYKHGGIVHQKGTYHLSHADGKPFFWAGCTVWNGTLKSTDEEWATYLKNRADNGYSVIQFVTTQWRGCEKNSEGQVAFEGSGKIAINPLFFKHLDGKIDEINAHGLVAAPVLLWALATVQGRELSPGYYLPDEEAILLARYMVARYGGNQVVWILGGDGKYTGENEMRWKNIGRGVFNEEHPGTVALHPGGSSWIGEAYANEKWLDIIGYQSGHSNHFSVSNFINKGPVAQLWHTLPPRPYINMEPVYEEIHANITPVDIRNAGYWSLLNAPTAGITYGANGLWAWLRDGEVIINHHTKGESSARWYKALDLPGSIQTGYLANFMRKLEWWKLKPSPELLVKQPGDLQPENFIAVSKSSDSKIIMVYMPKPNELQFHNLNSSSYKGSWYNPVTNKSSKANLFNRDGLLTVGQLVNTSMVLLLEKK